jgi:membrane protein required for beta-lactamase induction
MRPIIDPRDGDIEDDASSTKRRSLFSLAGSLLVEISLPKLAVAWTLLIGLPGIILGIAPLLLSLWIGTVSWKASNPDRDLAYRAYRRSAFRLGWPGSSRA